MFPDHWIRLGFFLLILVAMGCWEAYKPKRQWQAERLDRWFHHLMLSGLNTVLISIIVPASAAFVAFYLESIQFGLLNRLPVGGIWNFLIGILILDLAIYTQHVVFHKVPIFWRFHRMHHTDVDFDVTTAVRFHPIEIMISFAIKLCVVAIFGLSPESVLAFAILLNGTSMFNHANVRIPQKVDKVLRWFLVTPDMHRVHHSIVHQETDSNFGFNLPWWDRIFRTYRQAPEAGHDKMTIGLPIFRDKSELRIDRLISQPFRKADQPS